MSRPDTLILSLNDVKKEINLQIMHCTVTLNKIRETSEDANYDTDATALEKSNISSLDTLITNVLAALEAVVWE